VYHIFVLQLKKYSTNILEEVWKNFTNIDRIVTRAGSNEAPGCTYEYGSVSMLAPKSGWWLSMVLITFLTLKFENRVATYWKNFTNIDRIVTRAGSKVASGCTYEYGSVSMLAPKSGWYLCMVLITFLTLKFVHLYLL
jgi:uncharacterized membrane protein